MQIKRTSKSTTSSVLHITADEVDLEPIRKHTLSHFKRDVKVPGFRTGMAPAELVEKNIDQKLFLDEFLEHALNHLFGKALEHENLRPVSRPNVELKKFVPYSQLEFEVSVENIGEVKVPDYKKIKLEKPKVSVSAKDINDVLKSLQQRLATRTSVARPAKMGDQVVIDFVGKDNESQPISGAEGKDYPIIIGSRNFIPGFEEELVGLKAGDSKKFTLKFPADYNVTALRSADVTFEIDVKVVDEMEVPALTDELAAKAGPFKLLAELKADVKKQLTTERQLAANQQFENELIKTISDKSQVAIPASLIDTEVLQMEEDEKRNLVQQGQTWQEHLKQEGISEQQHRDRQRPQAEARVKAGLVLSEIAEKEKISVTTEELDGRIILLKGQFRDQQMQAELDKPENRRDIEARILTEKTIARLVEYSSR